MNSFYSFIFVKILYKEFKGYQKIPITIVIVMFTNK